MEQLLGLREELIEMLKRCQAPEPEGLWQLSDWCITMQSIIDVESQLKGLYRAAFGRISTNAIPSPPTSDKLD
jgi:hypothetical protein